MTYHDPSLLPADTPRLKKFTKYRCPNATGLGHSSLWTGAMYGGQAPHDHLCSCGARFVEAVEDGNTYRVTFETISPHDVGAWKMSGRVDTAFEWHTATRDSTDRASIANQAAALSKWAETREEPIRNVQTFAAETIWQRIDLTGEGSAS